MPPKALYAKGITRRKILIDAAASLLAERPIETISLHHIAKKARIPPGSAYHFFANAQEVFMALAERFGQELIEAIIAPYPPNHTNSWQQLYGAAVDRGVDIYRQTPAYCILILGPNSPPTLKFSDRKNDVEIGKLFTQILELHFDLPDLPNLPEKVFYSIEIVDLLLSLSFIYHQTLKHEMIEEGKLAAIAYLKHYLPDTLPHRIPKLD